MFDLKLNVFGFPEVRIGGRPVVFKTRKTLALLIYLTLEPGWHSRDKLAALLWPESDQEQGRGSLRKSLTMMCQALGDAFPLRVERDRVGLLPDRLTNDLSRLHPDSDELPAGALEGVLRDFSLADAPGFDEWLEAQRKSLQERLDAVLQTQIQRHRSHGRSAEALALAKARAVFDPYGEETHLELMRLLWDSGLQRVVGSFAALERVVERVAVSSFRLVSLALVLRLERVLANTICKSN